MRELAWSHPVENWRTPRDSLTAALEPSTGEVGSVSAGTCTPSSSSSSGGDGGGVLTSTSSVTDSSLFLLESFLAALDPPSDSAFLLLRDRKRGRQSQHTPAVRVDDEKNSEEFTQCTCVCACVSQGGLSMFDLSI